MGLGMTLSSSPREAAPRMALICSDFLRAAKSSTWRELLGCCVTKYAPHKALKLIA